jgi:hypothetical protein
MDVAVPNLQRAITVNRPGPSASIEIKNISVPQPGINDVLIRLSYTGVCHGDISLIYGDWEAVGLQPDGSDIPGHEGVGTIVKVGSNVKNFAIGDRAGVKEPVHFTSALLPFGIGVQPPSKGNTGLSDRTGQCCFLCLESKQMGHYAVQVPYIRPTKPRRVLSRRVASNGDGLLGGETYEEITPQQMAYESDTAIYDTCFDYQGKWKRWLPFYGVTNVREVEVG